MNGSSLLIFLRTEFSFQKSSAQQNVIYKRNQELCVPGVLIIIITERVWDSENSISFVLKLKVHH